MRRLRRTAREAAEAVLFYAGLAIVPFLPRRAVLGLARGLGTLGYLGCRRLRRVAMANLQVAFGDTLPPARKAAIALASFRLSARVLLDFLWFGRFTARRVAAWVRLHPSLLDCVRSRPLVAVTGHFGNWEMLGLAAAMHGHIPMSVAAPIKNRIVDRWVRRRRGVTGQQVQAKRGAVQAAIADLRAGGVVALLVDQKTQPREGGAFVPLFGVPMALSRAPGLLAARAGADVVFAWCVAGEDGGYECRGAGPLRVGGRRPAPRETDEAVARWIEERARALPGQWLWAYKYWQYLPTGHGGGGFPFYAKKLREDREA
jgi:Kdo2-lipid IVA lauroyltransferase/acyltransferase